MPVSQSISRPTWKAEDFNLLEVIGSDSYLELKAKVDGGEFWGPCPFCHSSSKDKSDRFHVWPYSKHPRFWCRVCGTKGNVFNYVMLKYNVGFGEAIKILGASPSAEANYPKSKLATAPPSLSALTNVHIPVELVERLHRQNFDIAFDYWRRWYLTEETMHLYQLGYVNEYVGGICYHGYTIPHWWTTEYGPALKAVKVRSADQTAPLKYLSFSTSVTGGIFNDRHTSAPDGSRVGPALDICFVTEDERTAMMLDQWYPAVAYFPKTEWNPHLNEVFRRVGEVIILADNDGPGIQRALQVREYLGGKDTMILKPKDDKQLSDMAVNRGIEAVHDWISRNIPGLRPVEGRL